MCAVNDNPKTIQEFAKPRKTNYIERLWVTLNISSQALPAIPPITARIIDGLRLPSTARRSSCRTGPHGGCRAVRETRPRSRRVVGSYRTWDSVSLRDRICV